MYVLNTKSPKYIKQVSSIKGKIDTEAGRVEGLGTHFQSWVDRGKQKSSRNIQFKLY